ncbi:MAG: YqaA family protein [Kiloniellales bacterium]
MLRRLYDWTLSLAGKRHALSALAAISFIESSVFPIPPDVLLLPMVLARPERAWLIATVCSVASVAGGLLGYAIGALLFDSVGRFVVDLYGYTDQFETFRQAYEEWGFWIVAGAGFTPFPYKVITIASGVAALNLPVFLLASAVSRSARFFLEAALLWRFGAPIRDFVERHLPVLTWLFFALLLGGFLSVRYLF